ncbi:hypothetical protein LTR56_016040 [Elasticomyces elasticus]|nr:hypothetical protein LTR56_016040 [Elasticomyces elasticus]KAK3642486.1 hypothetical protein LTR22_016120 [Elasticomyces elasticus]KAK5764297.1 hypothetical protein LTS12_005510 [Elasticomyces elasticus]
MVLWTSPRDRAYHDASPISPLTPLSPSSLPQWLRSGAPKPSVLSAGRLKTYGVIATMVLLGFWITAALGPSEELASAGAYDATSGGILSDPSGFGSAFDHAEGGYGIIGSDDQDELEADAGSADVAPKKPSVKGALSELHHAVTDKLQSWNPYHAGNDQADIARPNRTTSAKGKKLSALAAPSGEVITNGVKDQLGARTRIGKCTILFNSQSYWERAIRTHEQHDKIHGYRLHVLREQLMDDVWSKPAYILSLLLRELSKPESERLEWLFWVDADTIILNPYVPIEAFLPPAGREFEDVHMIFTEDWNGLNNGVFPVRVNRWSVDLFSAIVSFRYYRPDDPLPMRDQSAMGDLLEEPHFSKHLVQAPQRWFNAYQGEHNETLAPFQIRRGDLLVHFAGVPDREKRMSYWLDRAEQHLDDWEIPVKSTSYPQESKDLWSEVRSSRKAKDEHMADTRTKASAMLTKTDERLNAYGDRVTDEQKGEINAVFKQLKDIIDNEKWQDKWEKVEELTAQLEQKCLPLQAAAEQSHKSLLSSAHEAIFAGEKDLMQAGFNDGVSDLDLQRISNTVKNLKHLVMSPEESWNNADLVAAVSAVTQARGRWQEKQGGEQAATDAQIQAEQQRAKTLEDARKQVQAEANQPAGLDDFAVMPEVPVRFITSSAAAVIVVTSVPVVIVTGHAVTVTPDAVVIWTTATVTANAARATANDGVGVDDPQRV